MSTQTVSRIRVVDFSKIEEGLKPGTSSWLSLRKQVCHALEELGCFMAVLPNKVISSELHNTMFGTLMKDLFDSPIETKVRNTYEKWPFCGHFTTTSVREVLGIYNPINPEETQKFTHLFWPNGNDQFRESADLYAKVMAELDQVVTRMVFENYGVDKYHEDHMKSTFYALQFSKYEEPKKVGSNGVLVSHTDKNFTTILHQNHVNGLEINTKDGEWISFDPLPSSFLFIASDVFQVWSNDRIRACKHRVTIREDEVRYSFGLFSLKEGVTYIPKELVDKDHPLRYKPLDQLEYIKLQKVDSQIEYTVKAYCGI